MTGERLALMPHLTADELRELIAAIRDRSRSLGVEIERHATSIQILASLSTAAHEALYSIDRSDHDRRDTKEAP